MKSIATRIPTQPSLTALLITLAALAALIALGAIPAAGADEPGYGFYRTVEGDARLTTLERAEPLDIEPNYPLLLGDRVWVSPEGRLEAVLPDQTVLRVGGGTDLYFEDLALYADATPGEGTILRLLEGEIQVVIADFLREREPFRIDTPNATLYLQEAGRYRIFADERQWSELVVREGFGEVMLAEGSVVARANEEVVIDGEADSRVRVYPAGALDALEAWGDELDREAQLASNEGYLDESLEYAAAPLRQHGEWLPVEQGYAWRPYAVASSWRPYSRGYWTQTPAGLYWVSAEPWGAVTAHYGYWSPHSQFGWVWYPGTVFSPAWVHWYWGPSHVGWVPSGYYSHYYGGHHGGRYGGLRFGTYGWASGSWGYYSDWTFCPTRYFGWRSYRTTWRSGAEIGRTAGHDVPRGVITTDTSSIPRGSWGKPDEVARHLTEAPRLQPQVWGQPSGQPSGQFGDVTDFVARRPGLTRPTEDAIFAGPDQPRSPIRAGGLPALGRTESPRTAGSPRFGGSTGPGGSMGPAGSPGQASPSNPVRSTGWGGSGSRSVELGGRAVETERRELPARPDAGRTDFGGRVVARPSESGSTWRSPAVAQPTEQRPRESWSDSLRTRESLRTRAPGLGQERTPSSPSEYLRQGRDLPASPQRPGSSPPGLGSERGPDSGPEFGANRQIPAVRRVLDGIRGNVSPAAPSGSTFSPPSTQGPTASPPSSSSSSPPSISTRRPTTSVSSGSTSRPPSGSFQKPAPSRGSSSNVQSGQSSKSNSKQSRSKSKPPTE